MVDTTLDGAAEELYGIARGEFVAARTALAASAPDRDTAAQIRGLHKPPTSAWVINLLARRGGEDLDRLTGLASDLREAQDERDAARLTALNRERRMLVAALVASAQHLAEEQGVKVGSGIFAEIERTLGAAARDEAAAAAVRTGRLVRALEASGVDPVDLTNAVAGRAPDPTSPERGRGRDDLAERRARREAERAAAAARREVTEAERESARAETRLAAARDRAILLRERVTGLESELERIRADADTAAEELLAAERAEREAAARVRAAHRGLGDRGTGDRGPGDPAPS